MTYYIKIFGFSLQQYPVPDNKTGTYVIDLLTKRILALGATQQGQFLVDCESYLSHPVLGKYYFYFMSILPCPTSWICIWQGINFIWKI